MDESALASVRGTPQALRDVVELTALRKRDGEPYFSETLFEFKADCVETPAGEPPASPLAYTTFTEEYFTDISLSTDQSVYLLLPVAEFLGWIDWFGDVDELAVTLYGSSDDRVAFAYEVSGGGYSVRVRTPGATERLEDVSLAVTEMFENGRYQPADPGNDVRHVETDISVLERIVSAVDFGTASRRYPVVLEGETLLLDVDADGAKVRSSDWAPEKVADLVTNTYGEAFAAISNTLSGDLTLEVVPGGSMAVRQDGRGRTLRYVLQYRS